MKYRNGTYHLLNKKAALFVIALLAVFSVQASAQSAKALLDSANTAYAAARYQKAIHFYEKIINENYSAAAVYYNLGNAYYKTNDLGHAILNYERAKRLAPNDPDILYNLKMANMKTVDKVIVNQPIFFVRWWDNFVNLQSEKGWSIWCIAAFALGLILLAVYFVSRRLELKQAGFWFSMLFFATAIFSFALAAHQYHRATSHDTGIIMSPEVTVKSAPNAKGTSLFVVHVGTKANIVATNGDWTEIKLSNGNKGWMKSASIEAI